MIHTWQRLEMKPGARCNPTMQAPFPLTGSPIETLTFCLFDDKVTRAVVIQTWPSWCNALWDAPTRDLSWKCREAWERDEQVLVLRKLTKPLDEADRPPRQLLRDLPLECHQHVCRRRPDLSAAASAVLRRLSHSISLFFLLCVCVCML